ncbi:hypothetical protein Tco_0167823 [Tanacetum coccineum]
MPCMVSYKGDLYKLLLLQIMAASAIDISFDSSDESVGSPPSRVILFGDILTVIPSTSVVDPETLLWLRRLLSLHPLDYVAWFPIRVTILIHQMRCLHQSTFPRYQLFHHSYAPILLRLLILLMDHHRMTLMLLPFLVGGAREAIPFGRPYRTHLNGPHKLLTARKRVGPLPAGRLAWRHASPRSSNHRSSFSSSSSDSSSVHSSGLDAPDQAHSGSSTRDVSPRLGHPPRRAPRRS